MTDKEILRELEERKKFVSNIKIEPYGEVKEFLDKRVADTVKESVDGMKKLFEPFLRTHV